MNTPDRWNMESPTAPPARRRMWGLGQRRTFLIDGRSQLRTTALASVVVAVVLTVLLVTLHVSRERATDALVAHVPSLGEVLAAQNRIEFMFQLAVSVVFLAMVIVMTLLETHKTAGAAFNLSRQMDKVRAGEYGTRVTLRRGDNLQKLGHTFNEMSIALDESLWRDIEIFSSLSEQANCVSSPQDARRLAEALNEHASARRRSAGFAEDDEPDSSAAIPRGEERATELVTSP